jgi:transcriptional antiterminator NusG
MAKNWYVVHTYSGFEKFVAESIRQRALETSIQDQIGQIIIPTEDVIEIKSGKKVVSTKRSYPGYILIEMEMTDENWLIIRDTPKVTGFVGSGKKPSPLDKDEVSQIVAHMETRRGRRCGSSTGRSSTSMASSRTSTTSGARSRFW